MPFHGSSGPRQRSTTIGDVARAAGVSRATVSRVMNGLPTVNEEIARRVRRSVEELDYTPSGAARSLSLGVSQTIGVVVPDLANPMFQQILHGFNRVAAADGYRVLVSDSREDPRLEPTLAIDARNRTDAVVLCAPRMPADDLAEVLTRVTPAVVINRDVEGVAVITVDYARGVRDLAEHLIALGHERIAFLAGPEGSRSNAERERGLEAVRQQHPDVDIVRVVCGSTLDEGFAAWDEVRHLGVTAILAFNDVVALGLLGRLDLEGVAVPEQLSVVGFDDIQYSRFASPALTTMHVPQTALGESAWLALRAQLTGELMPAPTRFRPELVVRKSTGVRS